jgi:hypothetical protein
MAGIVGGVVRDQHDICLGDIVGSPPGPNSSGVFQYNFDKTIPNQKFK